MDLASMKRRELQALCKSHGLAAGGSNADLAARLAATLSGCGGAAEKVVGVVVGKGCLKRSVDGASGEGSGAAKKVTFVFEDEAEAGVRGRRRRPRVVWSPVVAKTRGRRKAGEVLPAAEASGGRLQRKGLQVGGDSADEGVAGQVGVDAPVRRSRRNAVNLGAGDVVERVAGAEGRNNSVKAEEQGKEVGEAVDRKRKRKTKEDAEDIVVSTQVGVSRRSTGLSGLVSATAVVWSPVVEKRIGRRKAGNVNEQMSVEGQPADVQELGRTLRSGSAAVAKVSVRVSAVSPVVESKRSRRKAQEEEPAVQKAANVEISGRRKAKNVHSDGELPTVSEVPRNVAPVTRSLRNRAVQVNDSSLEDAHVGKKLENRRQLSRAATRRQQPLASSVEEEVQEQVAAPPQRRSRRNHSEANELLLNNNTTSENNSCSRAPMEANYLKKTWPSTHNTAKDSVEDDVAKEGKHLGFTKRNTRSSRAKVARNAGDVLFSDSRGKASAIEMQPEVIEPVRRLRRKSVVPRGQEFENAKGEDVEKQPAVKEPVRLSTRKSVVLTMLEKEKKGLTAEMIPEAHVRRSMRKSVLPNMLDNENKDHCEMFRSEDFQSAKGEDVEKQQAVKEPVRRSTRKSVVPAMLEKERKGIPAEMIPEAHVRRPMRKSVLPNMLNNENKNHGEMVRSEDFQSAKGGGVEKQPEVKEPVRRSIRKSVAPAVLEKENEGIPAEKKSEIPVWRPMRKSIAPNAVDNENMNHSEMVRRKESRVRTRVQFAAPAMEVDTSENKLQVEVAVQNDGLRRPTHKSSKHNLSDNNAHPGEDPHISRGRVGEGGLKLRKRRRISMEPSCSSNNSLNTEVFDGQKSRKQQKAQTPKRKDSIEDNHEKLARSQQQSKPTTSKGRPAKRRRTSALQEVMSVEEPKANDMVFREATQDEVTGEYSEESSSSIQEISQDNATGEEFPSAPLLGTLPEETCRVQSVNEEIHGSESGDLDKSGQNPEICHPGATDSTHQCEQAQEHGDFKNDNSHLSEVRFGDLDQSSSIAELVPHAGFLSENKALLDEAEVDLGAKGMQTLNADSSEDGLGALNKSAGIAQEIRSTTAVFILEAEAPVDEGVNNNGMDSPVGVQDVSVALPEQLLGASDKLQIIDEVAPCTRDAVVMEDDSSVCDGANWTDIKSTEGIENGDIALSNDGLEAFKSIAVAEEVPSCTVAGILEDDTPAKEEIGMKNNEASLSLPEQLLGASDKLQIVDEVAPCTRDAVVMEDDPRVCDGANWTDIKSTEGIENGDIALSNDGLEAFKSIAVAEEVPSCTVAGVLEDDTLAKEEIGMKNNEASFSFVDTGSRGNESDGQPTKSLEASLFEFNPNYLPTVNAETDKQSDEEVASQFLSHCDDTSITVAQKDIEGVSTYAKHRQPSDRTNSNGFSIFSGSSETDVVSIDLTVGDHEEKYPASPVAEQNKVNGEANTNESAEKTLADIIPAAVLYTKDLQHDHDHVPGKLVDILAKETGKASGSDVNSHQCIFPTEHDESDNGPQVHSDTVAEKSIKDADLVKCLSNDKEVSSLSTTLHVEGATEDKSMFPIPSDVEGCSSDGRHSSFGLKFLFAEEDKESYLINDENTAVKVDYGNKSIDRKTHFYPGSDCGLEDEDVQLIGGDADKKLDVEQAVAQEESIAEDKNTLPTFSDVDACSSDRRHSLFFQKFFFAEERTGSYLTNDACVAAEIDCKKKLGDEIVSVYLESNCSLEEKDVGLVADNPNNKLAMEQVQQGDVQEGTLGKTSLGSATPEYKHEGGLPEEAVLHSMQHERCSSSAEQSPFGLQSLFPQESIESMEYGALAFARVHAESRVDESKDCHVKCRVEKITVSGSVSDHDTHAVSKNGGCMYTSQQDNEKEGLPKSSHEEEQVTSSQLGLLEAANCMTEETNYGEVACDDEENRKPVHSTDINSSCEKSDANGLAEHASCSSDAVLSSSVIAPANDNNEVHLSSSQSQLESIALLDEPIGCSNTEELHQGHNEQSQKEDQVASGARTSDIIEAATAKDLESGVTPLPAEERSNLRDEQLNSKLEGTEVVESGVSCDKHVSNTLEFGSAVNSIGKRTLSYSTLPKDTSMDHHRQQEPSNDFSVEKSPEESAMCWENSVSRAGDNVPGTIEKPSFDLATPDCKHEGAMSVEAVHSLNNDAGGCSSNLKQSPIGLQFLFSQENMEGSGTHDALELPSAENGVDESNVCHFEFPVEKIVSSEPVSYQGSDEDLSRVEENGGCMFSSQQDNVQEAEHASCSSDAVLSSSLIAPANDNNEVHLSSSQSQLESIALLDEPIGCSNTEELHQGHNEQSQKEDQVASGARTSDIIEAATAKDLESGVTPLPAEERSNLRDEQLNSKLEGTEVVESGVSCDKHVSNTLEFGSAVNSIGKRTLSYSTLPKDTSMDHHRQQEPSNDFSVEKSPEESAMCWENSVSRAGDNVPGTIEKPSFDLATPDCKHEGAMSVEAVHSLNNDAGGCSSNLKQSPIGLQFLFSQENMEGSGTHDALEFPSAENGVDEPNVCHFEFPVEKIVSSEPVSYQGSDEDLSRVEENGGCMFSSQQDNVQEGFSKSSHKKDWVACAQLDLSEDVSRIEREIIAEKVVCKEEDKRELMPYSAIDTPHEKSNVDGPAEHASGVSGTQYCSSRSTPICDEVHLSSNSSQVESLDALDSLVAFSNTEVLHQDHKEECNEHNEDLVTSDIPANGMSEAAPVEGSENGITLLPAAETPALRDKQLNPKLEGDEIILGSAICQTGDEISTKLLSFNAKVLHQDHKEECIEHNEDLVTPDIPASGMSEPAPIEGSESGMTQLPAAETSALPDEQLDPKLEGNEVVQHSLSCNKDTTSISDTGSVENNNLSSLPKDSCMDSCHEQQIPNDLSAPKSLEESAVCQDDSVHMDCFHEHELPSDPSAPKSPKESAIYRDDSVRMACFHEQELQSDLSLSAPKSPEESAMCPGDGVSESVGICQTSGRRRIDEISTKLPSFKISSAVKGSYIATNAPATTKQGDDHLSQSALALLRNRENTPAVKTLRPVKPNPDRSAAKNSSRRALQTISGVPRDH